ncbi:MAG: FG-GAP-like repeat-containing protein [Pseudomonadota bacterium]|nr:FG-GAP-like repeat-containing protein [Pseudomonadota bacterium]
MFNHAVVALTITNQMPPPNTLNSPVNTDITVTFDQNVDTATVNGNTFTIDGSISGSQTATFTVIGNTVTFNPNRDFHFGEVITVTLTTDIKNTSATALDTAFTWQFVTETLPSPNMFSLLPEQALGNSISRSVALGDLDQDGDLDAFVANSQGQANRVWFNDSYGNFTDSGQLLGALRSFEVVLADLDQDGDLDAFVANQGGEPSKVWLNNGAGIFTDSGQNLLFGTSDSYGVALGDLDNDGDFDAFIVNKGANRVWLNDGSGTFLPTITDIGAAGSNAVALGDIDQDGDLDAVVANDNDNKLWLNDGSANFTDSGQLLGGYISNSVALGDLNHDGDLDIIFANDGTNTVWFNNGKGIFVDSTQNLGPAGNSYDVALGDVDGDSDLDAFFVNDKLLANQVWVNNGGGILTDSNQMFNTPDISWGLALGDIDDDGDLDAFIANENNQPNKVQWNGETQIRIIEQTPLEDAVGIPVDANISVQFNRDLDATTLNASSFTVSGARSAASTGLFSITGNTLLFQPQSPFEAEELVTVSATLVIQSLQGHRLYQPQSWSFYTLAEPSVLEDELLPTAIEGLRPLPPTMKLSILIKGSGDGQVNIAPFGMQCTHQSCTYTYKTADWVSLIPQAAPGTRFQFWGGHPDCSMAKLHMIQNYTCHAYFEAIYPLQVSRKGEGTIRIMTEDLLCHQTRCRYFFAARTQIQLAAFPATGWQFQRWQGQCTEQGQVLLSTEQHCQAVFIQSTASNNVSTTPSNISPSSSNSSTPNVIDNKQNDTISSVPPTIPNETISNVPPTTPQHHDTPQSADSAYYPEHITTEAEQPPCPLIKGSTINFICNAQGRTAEDITLGPEGNVSHVVLVGTIENNGWLSNLSLQADSQINGGILTGYVDNQGLIKDIDFRGKQLTGGTLSGTIINNSEVDGSLTDIHLAANTQVIGGQVAGLVTGDSGAQLVDLVIAADSHLEQVTLAADVQLAGPVDLAPSVNMDALLTQEHLESPYLLANLRAEAISQLSVETFSQWQPQQLTHLSAEALAAMSVEQFQALPEASLSGLTADNLGGLSAEIIQTMTADHLAQLSPQAFAGLEAEQLSHMNPQTLTMMNTAQFKHLRPQTLNGLTAKNIKGLSTAVISAFTLEHLQALNSEAFKQQTSQEVARFFIHLSTEHIQPQETQELLPANWDVNPESGQLIPPSGTQLILKPKVPKKQSITVELPQVPDLESSFGVGSRGPTVREGMGRSLAEENLENFILSQEDSGILKVAGSGEAEDIQYAFIPDMDKMIQVNEAEIPIGLSQDPGGFYLITTPDKQQFRVIPAPKDPLALSAALNGGQVKIGPRGDVLLRYTPQRRAKGAQQTLTVMFNPFVQQPPKEYCRQITQEKFKCDFSQAPKAQQPGLHLEADEGLIVYLDGSAQRIMPTVRSPDTFIDKGLKVAEGIDDIIYRSDGGFDLWYRGQRYLITFDFKVEIRTLRSEETPPSSFSKENGRFIYHVIEDPHAAVRQVLSFKLSIKPNFLS